MEALYNKYIEIIYFLLIEIYHFSVDDENDGKQIMSKLNCKRNVGWLQRHIFEMSAKLITLN